MSNGEGFLCGDCGVEEGELHLEFCDHEHCSKCGKQILGWHKKGRCEGAKPEPFFANAQDRCARCDCSDWGMVMVPDEEWKAICGVSYKLDCVLCERCMDYIADARGITLKKKRINFEEKMRELLKEIKI